MANLEQHRNRIFRIDFRAIVIALALTMLFAVIAAVTPAAQAQTYTVIHNFTDGGDGAEPQTGLTIDAAGNLYGTTDSGGTGGYGTVFRLKHRGSGWTLNTLYSFNGGSLGTYPSSRVLLAHDGTLYGTTSEVIYHLKPFPTAQVSVGAPWSAAVVHTFQGRPSDGGGAQGDLFLDPSGNIYGTTEYGGSGYCGGYGCGVVYEVTPSGGGWTETVLYSFPDGGGSLPRGGVVSDTSSNFYGVTELGGSHGVVYELSQSGSGWTEQSLHNFSGSGGNGDGDYPIGGLIIDASGNLYGTTEGGGTHGQGTAFELTPVNGSWTFNTIYSFSAAPGNDGPYYGPEDKLVMDAVGNLYGTTYSDGAYHAGSVFKLTPSNGGWTYTSLHDFCAGGSPCTDGFWPISSLVLDASGNLYGTTSAGGTGSCNPYGCGVVFEITP